MDKAINFTNCERVRRSFGGSDRKFPVRYNNSIFMLKFSEKHAKKTDISTSYVNNALAEYISSHIAQSVGIPTHDTVMGEYHDEIVVGCKDFRKQYEDNLQFSELMHTSYDSKDIHRVVKLSQIYHVLSDPNNDLSQDLQKQSIKQYWDTFVIDALVGNFDRHIGNWGYLINSQNNEIHLSPTYDYGSTLFPQLSDDGIYTFIDNDYELLKRCMVFPSPALFILDSKSGKVGYYDLLSSDYDHNCTEALLRIVPKVNLNTINAIIDNTPFLSEAKNSFYKKILSYRKVLILDRAYERCINQNYDKEAYNRIINGEQYSEKLLLSEMDQLKTYYELSGEINEIYEDNKTQHDSISTTTNTINNYLDESMDIPQSSDIIPTSDDGEELGE